jgi:hypothetical protein
VPQSGINFNWWGNVGALNTAVIFPWCSINIAGLQWSPNINSG